MNRRQLLAFGVAAAGSVPVLAACAPPSGAASGAGAAGAGTEDGAFPVTIPHRFGETVIEQAPTRVVVVGLVEQDALLALGLAPVAVTQWFADDVPGKIYPWATGSLGGAEVPVVLDNTDGYPMEQIAGLAPDLIIGQYVGLEQRDYDLMSGLAKTIAQPAEHVNYGVPWEQATVTVGTAIGKRAAAEELVAGVKQQIVDAADPAFAGRTAVVVTPYEGIFVYGPEDPRGRILIDLGFSFPEALANPDSEEFGWSISAERVNELADVDVVVWIASEDEVAQATGGGWSSTTAAREGRGVFIDSEANPSYSSAFSFVTPLSIPYVLERYVPQLKAAVDGDPATGVPSVQD